MFNRKPVATYDRLAAENARIDRNPFEQSDFVHRRPTTELKLMPIASFRRGQGAFRPSTFYPATAHWAPRASRLDLRDPGDWG